MKLSYNGFDWSTIGEISVSQSREFEGGEQTQRAKVKLAVGVDIFQATYDQSRPALEAAAASLALPNGVLQWVNDAAGTTYVNQTAVLVSQDLPEDWGQYHQRVNLVFQYYEQAVAGAANNLPLVFVKGPEPGQAFHFSIVNRWQHSAGTERFSALRSQRQLMKGKVHVEGQIFGDTTLDLAARRAGLASQAAGLAEAMNSSEGRLTFGAGGAVFNQTVRIEEFTADLDQLINAVNFAFTASYTLFPDESDYATAEWTAAEKNEFQGVTGLVVAGKIQAPDEAAARAKLAALLAQVVSDYGYLAGQPLGIETTPNGISANSDGDTFTELTFSASYRKWDATNQLATLSGLALGQVNKWVDQIDTTRFSPMRDQRERTEGKVQAGGTWVLPGQGNAMNGTSGAKETNILSNRGQLLGMQRALKAAAAAASVTLAYGDWTQVVRVTNFTAEINQAETGIDWSMTVTYTLFPNEASYALAEYTCAERDDFTGELRLSISGRIQAQDEAAARAKLAAVLLAQLTARDYLTLGVSVSFEATPNAIEADADGATFTELAFAVQYKKWKASNQAASYGVAGGAPVSLGNIGKWHDRVSVTRFNPLRPHRERSAGTIEAAGCWRADLSLPVAQRRKQLLAQQRAMKAAVNVPEGTLTYADWSQVTRVTEFNAEINQAETELAWTLNATYTIFPSESDYTTTEWTAQEKDPFTGELMLVLGGKVQATTHALAYTQMQAVVTAATTQWGYAAGQQISLDHTSANLSANGDGDTFTELSFSSTWRKWKSTNQLATFKATGRTNARALGQVNVWRVHYAAQRFNEMRSQRRHATGGVVASGTLAGNMAASLADRRTTLLAQVATLLAEVNGADGLLVYGSAFSQTVRIEDFQAEVNQAETGIEWSMTASYSLFPNEGGYATAEYTLQTRSDVESGDEFLAFAGKIGAPTGALALAKLTSLRTATLAAYGWNVNQQVRADNSYAHIYANGDKTATVSGEGADGTTFLELAFSEEYRRRMLGTLISSTLTISNREDITSQTLTTTYAGSVTATGGSVDAAYATALQRAQALGANREAAIDPTAFLKGSTLAQEQRWTTAANGVEFVRLAFSYDYQSKLSAGRAYLEMTTAVQQDVFGVDAETCSGFIAARDQATAAALYLQQIVPIYEGRLIHTQQTSFSQSQNQTSDDTTDQIRTTGQGRFTMTAGSGPGAAFNTQHTRMEFNLTVFSPKAAGVTGLKYSMEVTRDFLTLELRLAIQGSCYAGNRVMADTAVTALLAGVLPGQGHGGAPKGMAQVRSRRVEDRESNTLGTPGDGVADVLLKLDFEEEYVGRVTGTAGVIEMELTEEVVYSGTRWSVQPLPFNPDGTGGVSIPQPSGLEHGSRSVTGSVTAGTFATAQAWGKAQRTLLTGDALGGKYPQPEKWTTGYQFVPQIDGIPKGAGANVKLFKVGFAFGEVLPLYPAP